MGFIKTERKTKMKKIIALMIISVFCANTAVLAAEEVQAPAEQVTVEQELEAAKQELEAAKAELETLKNEAAERAAAEEQAVLQATIEETVVGTENLDMAEYSPSDVVNIYETKYVVTSGSVVKVSFNEKFRSKNTKKGDTIIFVNTKPIVTTKGTHLIPAHTQFVAKVVDFKKARRLNHNAQLYIQFEKMVLNGKEIPMNARPFFVGYALKEKASKNVAKVSSVTAVAAGVGTAAGALLGSGGGAIIAGLAIGGGVGLVGGLVGPGVNYRAKAGEEIPIVLIDDLELPK